MNMPGFTAECALDRASRSYRASRSADVRADGRAVLPQAGWIVDQECYYWCLRLGLGSRDQCLQSCGQHAWV